MTARVGSRGVENRVSWANIDHRWFVLARSMLLRNLTGARADLWLNASDPARLGGSVPGSSIGHIAAETKSTDTSIWDRF
jgi:hypothetical protein